MTGEAYNSASVPGSFEYKKRAFFSNLAVQEIDALRMHKKRGLWERTPEGSRDWGNVAEHCLVEVARAQIFAELLGLSSEITADMMQAAAVHDYFKRVEKEIMTAGGFSYDSYAAAQKIVAVDLPTNGYSERVTRLAGAVGHETSLEAQRILGLADPNEDDIAYLVMHYIDDYTINSDWAGEAEDTDGNKINDLDRRLDSVEANPRYQTLNQEGTIHFNGETPYTVQRRVGHAVEQILAELIGEQTGKAIDPVDLPVYIDGLIKEKIETNNRRKRFLSKAVYELVVESVPIVCVDFLPVKFDPITNEPQIGIITRATGPEAGKPALLGGRVEKNETLVEAIIRHLEGSLGESEFSFHEGNAVDNPYHVAEYTHAPTAEGGYDPTKHSIALTYLIDINEPQVVRDEASDFRWISLDQIPETSAYNHHLAMRKAAEYLRNLHLISDR